MGGLAPHSSTLAWKIPWTEEPGEPRVRKIPWSRKWPPAPVFLPGEIPLTEEPGVLLLPPIPPSIRVYSNESTLRMRWCTQL